MTAQLTYVSSVRVLQDPDPPVGKGVEEDLIGSVGMDWVGDDHGSRGAPELLVVSVRKSVGDFFPCWVEARD